MFDLQSLQYFDTQFVLTLCYMNTKSFFAIALKQRSYLLDEKSIGHLIGKNTRNEWG